MEKEIKVSVICLTYNHEDYLERALESILSQTTSFQFELLIHDDASTDNTKRIIKKYKDNYPDIITAIYEEQNQFSKGVDIVRKVVIPVAKGEYFALCEGDDYWTDNNKLQKQIDFLDNHIDFSWCVHAAKMVDVKEEDLRLIAPYAYNCEVKTKDVIKGGGGFIATNSIVARKEIIANAPSFFDILSFDWVVQMYLASKGKTYYFADVMSAYRKGAESSWSYRTARDMEYVKELAKKSVAVRELFDIETNYKYHEELEFLIGVSEAEIAILEQLPKKYWTERAKKAKRDWGKYDYYTDFIRLRYPKLHLFLSSQKKKLARVYRSRIEV